ncbi:MAG: CoB--CoM heterodisulfide reductase-like protein [Thermoanaerobacterales bacterium 50_218]|nr:MAG: CoB--CoM heterodisulfide reductase-like protein [Thermoanaerobacterales bacterium 50_218]HAA89505.1 heterodisulfide reductase subunit B [Peptococcaceae bacterium]
MARYAFYPGCSLDTTAVEYGMSTHAVARKLGIEFLEVPDWNCCGASSAHMTDHLLALALPARVLALAETLPVNELVAPCAACHQRFAGVEYELSRDEELKKKVNSLLDRPYTGKVKVKSFLEVFANPETLDKIQKSVKRSLKGLKVACYYGCLFVKPPKVFNYADDPENPQAMDNIIRALGAEPVPWPYKTECCGASLAMTDEEICTKLCNDILRVAKDAGADCVVTCCPVCQQNLDMRQVSVENKYGTKYRMPVPFFTQLIGLALGIDAQALGFKKLFVSPVKMLQKVGAA